MLPAKRGGVVTRYALLLALLAMTGWGLTGCRNAAPPLLAVRQTVRLDALLPLHPAWAQVQALDAAQARFPAAQALAAALKYPLTPLPEIFTPPGRCTAQFGRGEG